MMILLKVNSFVIAFLYSYFGLNAVCKTKYHVIKNVCLLSLCACQSACVCVYVYKIFSICAVGCM